MSQNQLQIRWVMMPVTSNVRSVVRHHVGKRWEMLPKGPLQGSDRRVWKERVILRIEAVSRLERMGMLVWETPLLGQANMQMAAARHGSMAERPDMQGQG